MEYHNSKQDEYNKQLCCLSLRWENTLSNRYYHLYLSQDLLGDWVITKAWGGINRSTGRVMHVACASEQEAQKEIKKLIQIRERRGYKLSSQHENTSLSS